MRRTLLVSLIALLAAGVAGDACAQRRGGGGAGFARGGGFSGGRGGAAYGFHHAYQPQRFGGAGRGYRGYGYGNAYQGYGVGYAYLPYDDGDGYLPYDYSDAYPYEGEPVVQQPPVFTPPAPPVTRPPGHSVITEYNWPATSAASSGAAGATSAEPEGQEFAIVLKNGSTLTASTVFAEDDGLHYVDPDERHLRIAMSEVNRAATLKANRARNLNLYLPAAE